MSNSFSLLEKQLLALHYNGSYITNFEMQEVARDIGLQIDLADREKMLKKLLQQASEHNKLSELATRLIKLLNDRLQTYQLLLQRFPNSASIIQTYIQKTRSTQLLVQQRLRTNPYE